jgi:hypothetical protein
VSPKVASVTRIQAMRAFVKRIVATDFAGNVSQAARTLKVPQSQLSDLLNDRGRGLGLVAAERVADYAGTTIDEVVGRSRGGSDDLRLLRSHPDWPAAVHAARSQHPEIDLRHFDLAGSLAFSTGLPEQIDGPFVAGIAGELRGLAERGRAAKPR